MKQETKALTLAKVNGQAIVVLDSVEKYVPVKPICDALGIASNKQIEKIKSHPILSSVDTLIVSTGSDGKRYEMLCLPYKYVLGWLFSIDSRNVKPEAAESVLKFQMECYEVLYNHFVLQNKFNDEVRSQLIKIRENKRLAKDNFKFCKNTLADLDEQEGSLLQLTFEQWRISQLQIPFPEPKTEEE